jgi:hypothetical protein
MLFKPSLKIKIRDNTILKMADALTVCAALMVFIGFSFLFWFIRRLGILQLEAAMMQDHFQTPKTDPQPMVEVKNPFKMTVSSSCTLGKFVQIIKYIST